MRHLREAKKHAKSCGSASHTYLHVRTTELTAEGSSAYAESKRDLLLRISLWII